MRAPPVLLRSADYPTLSWEHTFFLAHSFYFKFKLPIGLNVVWPAKELNFSRARGESFDDAVDFIWLVTGCPDFSHDHITVEASVKVWGITLHPYKTVLFSMVQPMASSARPDDPLQLVGFYPDNFIDSLVAPQLETVSTQFHSSKRFK